MLFVAPTLALMTQGHTPDPSETATLLNVVYTLSVVCVALVGALIWLAARWRGLNRSLSTRAEQIKELEQSTRDTQGELKRRLQEIQDKQQELTKAKHDLGAQKKKLHRSQEELKAFRKEAQSIQEKLKQKKAETVAFQAPPEPPPRTEIRETQEDSSTQKELQALQKMHQALEGKLQKLQTQLEPAQQERNTLRSEVQNLRKRVEDFRRIDIISKGKLEAQQDKLKQLGRQYYEAVSELAVVKGEVGRKPRGKSRSQKSGTKPRSKGDEDAGETVVVLTPNPQQTEPVKTSAFQEPTLKTASGY